MKKTILLVEDDAALADVYKIAIRDLKNIDLEVASLGKKAMDRIKGIEDGTSGKLDLLLLDLSLPDMNGIDILKEIRSNDKTKDIPVFVLSNYEINQIPELEQIKPDKFIQKTSINPTQFVEIIKEQLKEKN
jgi:CheY-like chemotaxis protein